MAHALREFMSVGVPHQVIKAGVPEAVLKEFGLEPGRSSRLGFRDALRLRTLLQQTGVAESGPGARLAIQLSMRGCRVGILDPGHQRDNFPLLDLDETNVIRPIDAFQKIPSTASANRFI